jgi:AcrR family transcriptional regulator
MKSGNDTVASRSYRQRVRAASTAETEARIRAAANTAFAAQRFDQVSLDDIAQRAGVRVPTILRHFGTKENLFVLSTHSLVQASQQTRALATPNTLRDVVALVVEHFEQRGSLILHFLNQEEQVTAIRAFTDEGRRYHRQWVIGMVTPLLPTLSSVARERLMVQICGLADVRFWQTLRHSLDQTRADTERFIFALMKGAISTAECENA